MYAKSQIIGKDLDAGKLRAGGDRGNRGWGGWLASPIQWTWSRANSGRWRGTGRPGMLQSMGLQRVRHDWATEQQPYLCDLMAAAACRGHSLWDLASAVWKAWGGRGQLGPEHLAPSVMMAGGLGTWPWGHCQLRSASLNGPGPWQEEPNWVLDKCSQAK